MRKITIKSYENKVLDDEENNKNLMKESFE